MYANAILIYLDGFHFSLYGILFSKSGKKRDRFFTQFILYANCYYTYFTIKKHITIKVNRTKKRF